MNNIENSLRERYSHIHPLLFSRSLEKAKSYGELFDILDTIPTEYPLIWDEEMHRWVHKDVLLSNIEDQDVFS